MFKIKSKEELDEVISEILRYSKQSRLFDNPIKELSHTSDLTVDKLKEEEKEFFGNNTIRITGSIKILIEGKEVQVLKNTHIVKDCDQVDFSKGYIFQEMYDSFMLLLVNTLSKSLENYKCNGY